MSMAKSGLITMSLSLILLLPFVSVGVEALTMKEDKKVFPLCGMGMGCGRHIEALVNDGEGLSYTGAAVLGNSYLDNLVWDTGSDMMVILTDHTFMPFAPCTSDFGRCYFPETDPCHNITSWFPSVIEYGSGGVGIMQAETTVMLGDGECPIQQPIMEITSSDIDLLMDGNINGIAGIAPNGFYDLANIEIFSWCAGNKEVSDPALMIWNDYASFENPLFPGNYSEGGFLTMPILHPEDPFYWAVRVESVALDGKSFGCTNGCAAIIDTGTSFLSFTHLQSHALEHYLDKIDECTEEAIATLPSIDIDFAGEILSIPPWEYVRIEEWFDPFDWHKNQTDVNTYVPDWVQENVVDYWRNRFPNAKFLQKRKGIEKECFLALAPPMSPSKSLHRDYVILLGDAFLRAFYTTYDRKHKTVSFAKKVNTDCSVTVMNGNKEVENEELIQKRKNRKMGMYAEKDAYELVKTAVPAEPTKKLRKLNPSKIMLGDAYHQFKRHGSFDNVHAAMRLRREIAKNATETHKDL